MEVVDIESLLPDERNANKGTLRGAQLLDKSLESLGAGRSVLLDRKRKLIAGNKTHEHAHDLGYREVVIVHTDGKRLVAVMRDDLDLDEDGGKARALAIADNRVSEVSLEWDKDALQALAESQPEVLQPFFFAEELAALFGEEKEKEPEEAKVESVWPEIKLRVPPQTMATYEDLMNSVDGETQADRFLAIVLYARRAIADEDDEINE